MQPIKDKKVIEVADMLIQSITDRMNNLSLKEEEGRGIYLQIIKELEECKVVENKAIVIPYLNDLISVLTMSYLEGLAGGPFAA